MILPTDKLYEKACDFLVEYQISNLPVNPFDIIKKCGYGLVTYTRLGELIDIDGKIDPLVDQSRDGFTVFNGRNYCIAYHSGQIFARTVFTLMHELGHIYLGHFLQYNTQELTEHYKELEEEASLFASFVLAPSVVISRCGIATPALLKAACGLSREAAVRRLEQYKRWRGTPADEPVERLLSDYIRANQAPRTMPVTLAIEYDEMD